jgi:hypothetical protein
VTYYGSFTRENGIVVYILFAFSFPDSLSLDVPPEHSVVDLYETLASYYADLGIPNEDLATFRKHGYYSTLMRPGLRAIAINSAFQYIPNL